MHDLFRGETFTLNPFLSVFVHFLYFDGDEAGEEAAKERKEGNNLLSSERRPLQGIPLTLVERQFVTLLITGAAKDWLKKTPR